MTFTVWLGMLGSTEAASGATLNYSGLGTDLALDGAGWFLLNDILTGQLAVTVHGQFHLDSNGRLVSAEGWRVQGRGATGKLQDIIIDGQGRPSSATPTATLQSYSWDAQGQLKVTLSDGITFVRAQLAVQMFRHSEALIRLGYRRYAINPASEPLAQATTPGKEGTGLLVSGALSTEPEPLRLQVLPGQGVETQGALVRTGIATELAIQGPGVFLVRQPTTGNLQVTRAGLFLADRDGYLITYDRWRVQGVSSSSSTTLEDVNIFTSHRSTNPPSFASVHSYYFDADGKIHLLSISGIEAVTGQIRRFQVNQGASLRRAVLGRYPVSQDRVHELAGSNWLGAGDVELVSLTPDLLATRHALYQDQQGSLTRTNSPSALAISGQGMFLVRDPITQERFVTRVGDFNLDASGYLTNSSGLRLQGLPTVSLLTQGDVRIDADGHPATTAPSAKLKSFQIQRDGTITVRMSDGTEFVRGQITLQLFLEPFALKPAGNGLYTNLEGAGLAENIPPGTGRAGMVEAAASELPNPAADLAPTESSGFRILVSGEPGTAGIVESSTEFADWIPWLKFELQGAETEIADPGVFEASTLHRFYRARQPSP